MLGSLGRSQKNFTCSSAGIAIQPMHVRSPARSGTRWRNGKPLPFWGSTEVGFRAFCRRPETRNNFVAHLQDSMAVVSISSQRMTQALKHVNLNISTDIAGKDPVVDLIDGKASRVDDGRTRQPMFACLPISHLVRGEGSKIWRSVR